MNPTRSPQTIFNEIVDSINALIESETNYPDRNSFVIKRIEAECNKLTNVDPAEGHLSRARLESLCGINDQMRYYVDCARAADPSCEWQYTLALALVSQGFCTEALPHAIAIVDPTTGNFSSFWHIALMAGAFQTVWQNYQRLESMGIEHPKEFPVDVEAVSDALHAAGVSDMETAELLEIAGSVMRSRDRVHVMSCAAPRVIDTESGKLVHFRFEIDGSAADIAAANVEIAEKMAMREAPAPWLVHVSFGAQQ